MRKTLILLILISFGLVTSALADGRHNERHDRRDQWRVERNYSSNVRHDRGERYGHFQQKMKRLRMELRHERRENRRLERRVQRIADRRHSRRWSRPAPVVIASPRPFRPLFFPRIVVHIPLIW